MRELTEREICFKAENYCVQAERCSDDVYCKMQQWGATEEQSARIMEHLLSERYVDESRFAKAFARDKMRYNHWGRIKIQYALKEKGIATQFITDALSELDNSEYMEILYKLLKDKQRQVTGRNDFECRQKLIRFALGRGFAMQEVLCTLADLNVTGDEDF